MNIGHKWPGSRSNRGTDRIVSHSFFLSLALALACSLVSGCASSLDPDGVGVYTAHTQTGVGWVYRANERTPERIIVGHKLSHDLSSDAAALDRIWQPLDGHVQIDSDSASQFIVIQLDDRGTGRLNPFRGGFRSWGMAQIRDHLKKTFKLTGAGADPLYSIHLVAIEDEIRPLAMDKSEVAQVRVRRLAKILMEDGIDPRLITAQVIPARLDISWKLAIVLRPGYAGSEDNAAALLLPKAWVQH